MRCYSHRRHERGESICYHGASTHSLDCDPNAHFIIRFCWGLGGVTGAIIGGSCEYPVDGYTGLTDYPLVENPADKWPEVFGKVSLLVDYPYLLPCALAASITLTGAFLDRLMLRAITHVPQALSCRCF